MSLGSILLLSKGVQIALLVLSAVILFLCMRVATLSREIRCVQDNMNNYLTTDDYFETFNNLLDEKLKGNSVSKIPRNGLDHITET